MTARDLISSSLRLLNVIGESETPSGSTLSNALNRLNGMIKSWNIEGLLIHKVTREELSLGASATSKTIGATGDIVTTRPTKITYLGIKDGTTEYPIELITAEEYASISNKSITSSYPSKAWVQGTYPNETISFWPVPNSGLTLVVQSRKPLSSTLAATDALSFPDGYEDALEYNLTVRLAADYGKPLDPVVYELASNLKSNLMRQNSSEVLMESPLGLSREAKFNSGEY